MEKSKVCHQGTKTPSQEGFSLRFFGVSVSWWLNALFGQGVWGELPPRVKCAIIVATIASRVEGSDSAATLNP
jgi:hypothetical protein